MERITRSTSPLLIHVQVTPAERKRSKPVKVEVPQTWLENPLQMVFIAEKIINIVSNMGTSPNSDDFPIKLL